MDPTFKDKLNPGDPSSANFSGMYSEQEDVDVPELPIAVDAGRYYSDYHIACIYS